MKKSRAKRKLEREKVRKLSIIPAKTQIDNSRPYWCVECRAWADHKTLEHR